MNAATPAAGAAIRVLLYHHVGVFAKPPNRLGLYCHVDRFARHMRQLVRPDLTVISLDRALAALRGEAPLKQPGVVLTFDDAFVDFHCHAWPILAYHGFPATVFAVSDRLGATADWQTEAYSEADHRLMDGPALRELADAGIEIGAHSATHPRLSRLNAAERTHEIDDSGKRLADVLGREVRHFAYPYGDYDADVMARVENAGFASGLTCIRDRAERAASRYEIPREGMSFKDGPLAFAYKTRWRHGRNG
ncbi:polysaccharide deacetylase family protein [Salinisphaera sp. Q1T1-3]|uniref:polysaccharide deacetylase family protein n=1 Tax=Salinisphaera sp. Q1T1-3 TaxID=2321229 RepID=UPI000E7464F3|nr:polysaccharide deacetylase family protein [Salinisphaera sp. Q1T1-3]RJS91035.1 polysaccharide deacetylase family protein [Salinisphaera sp. Q1T1-3]